MAVGVARKPLGEVEVRLPKEDVAALVLDGDELAQDRAHGLAGHLAVGGLVLLGVLRHVGEHGTQVLEVNEQEVLVVRDAEDNVEHALLDLGELEQAREQRGTHVGDRDAHRDALAAEHVPEAARAALVGEALEAKLLDALLHVLGVLAGRAHAGDVALDVGHEDGDARLGEALGHDLERHGLARAGRAGDEAVAVGLVEQQADGLARGLGAHTHPDGVVLEHESPLLAMTTERISAAKNTSREEPALFNPRLM